MPPTAIADPTAAVPSNTPSAVGMGGTSSSIPPPTPEGPEVILGRPLRSGIEPEATLTPFPQVMSRAHQALQETEAAIRWEWEALEGEHQHLGDWCTQLEKRTKAASCQFASERAELEQGREDFKEDIRKVFDQEQEVTQKEKSLVKKKEHLDQREEAVTALHDKLKAYNTVLEKQRDKQAAVEAKLQQELADKANNIAHAEESLKVRETSLEKRATDLTWQEEDLTFMEEMWSRRNKLLDVLELEVEEKGKRLEGKVRALEEQVRQFQAAQTAQATQTASGPQVVEVMRKTLDDLWAEQCAGPSASPPGLARQV
jgi:chromosome segregation ATPase